ncbi:hypothetical protein Pflav_037570 [Phytohabitans flavus]|uniref:NADP-dependent oxidoreductase domain-containing protein n=1 Tax=Phytohabitans flavus TaxID=1076124 RepID=A0A6F8XU81_9ACTN|nr:aldo/keto reductase [Phytohabitans flavus]BCB77347.1 hypothetical protein Pflav_037570 [Phytohabitans flavus]
MGLHRRGVRRSLDESLARLGLDWVDLVLIHDPEDHLAAAVDEAYPALADLRSQGVVRAIGVGSKSGEALHRFARDTDVDFVMIAGRYTLLEQPALDTLLPECERRGVRAILAGVFNSGLLAEDRPHEGLPYEYGAAPSTVLDRARALAAACARHGTSLPGAAIAFAAAHPAVASVVVGAQDADQVRRNAALADADPPPKELWADLVAEGLLRPDAPVPGAVK